MKIFYRLFSLVFGMLLNTNAHAAYPKPWQIGFQDAAAPLMVAINDMHNFLLYIIYFIGIFVFALLVWVIYRFRESANPKPSKTSHNIMLEVIWTAIPVLIVAAIAVPSVKILYEFDKAHDPDLTIKAIGHQWYWSYEYPETPMGEISFDSYMIEDKDLKDGQLRLLEVDNRVVVPAGKTVRLLVTSADVLHSFALPSAGIKRDAVPGRINETWFKIDKIGVYYGQCSELCGAKHGFMPIAVQVVPEEEYQAWLQKNK